MKKYFLLQLKRGARFLLWAICVVLVLFGCLTLVYNAMVASDAAETAGDAKKVPIGVVGTAQDQYLQWGLAAMQFDSTAMSLELLPMEETAAVQALQRGEIAAYFVFPEDFLDDALYGNVAKLRFVSLTGAAGLVSIVKDQIITIADEILIACESGTYGVGDALDANGSPETYGQHVNAMALEYVDFLFDRAKMYRVEPIAQNREPVDRYMLGGLTVTMLLLSCLSFAPLYIRGDRSLYQVLRARRVGPVKQTLAEWVAYLAMLLLLLAVVAAVLQLGGLLAEGVSGWDAFVGALPVLVMAAALSYCMYSLSDHLISGVLLSFIAMLGLCFLGGCMYPIQFFPLTVQHLGAVLPTGIARERLIGCFMGTDVEGTLPLLGYSAAFMAIAVAARACRAGSVRG